MAAGLPKLYLASESPRRLALLRDAGYDVEVLRTGVDDALLRPGETPDESWPTALAYLKAVAGLARARAIGVDLHHAVVLGSDTVIFKNGSILGQPTSAAHAFDMISALDNGSHRVVTGVALLRPSDRATPWRRVFADEAHVTLGSLGPERIRAYVATGAWQGKAGGYNLAERIADGWPIAFDGDPATVMGLPIRRLGPVLRRLVPDHPEP
jgi:septum formation protein